MNSSQDNNNITAELVLKKNYVTKEDLQDCLLEMEVSGNGLLDILRSKKLVQEKEYEELKLALRLSQTTHRGEQEEILLAGLLKEAQMVDSQIIEQAFLKKKQLFKKDETIAISQILQDMGAIKEDQIQQAKSLVKKMKVKCEKCGENFQLENLKESHSFACPNCTFVLLPDTQNIDYSFAETIVNAPKAPKASIESTASQTAVEDIDYDVAETLVGGGKPQSPPLNTTDSSDPFIGTVLGECKITKKLGQGGMGAVYLGMNLKLERREAIKVLTADVSAGDEQLIRFKREARAAGTLDSIHIVRVQGIGEDKGVHYISMEYVEGQSLQDILEDKQVVPLLEAINYIKQAAKGLLAAHEKEIIHRDIKPDNLMVSTEGIVKVADFGLARKIEDTMGITQTGSIMGTPYYMSPEQCGGEKTDPRSDIYSLGATFYHLLIGERPFGGETPMAILLKHMNEELTYPHKKNPEIPESISNIIGKMMEKKGEDRYQSLSEFLEDIQTFEGGQEIGISSAKKKRIFRKRLQIASLFMALVLTIFFLYYQLSQKKSELEIKEDRYLIAFQEGQAQYSSKKWNKALVNFRKAYSNNKTTEVKKILYKLYRKFGNDFYKDSKKIKNSLKNLQKLINLLDKAEKNFIEAQGLKTGNPLSDYSDSMEKIGDIYVMVGADYLRKNNLGKAKDFLKIAQKFYDKIKGFSKDYLKLEKDIYRTVLFNQMRQEIGKVLSVVGNPKNFQQGIRETTHSENQKALKLLTTKEMVEGVQKIQSLASQVKLLVTFLKKEGELRREEEKKLIDGEKLLGEFKIQIEKKINLVKNAFEKKSKNISNYYGEFKTYYFKVKDKNKILKKIQKINSFARVNRQEAQKIWSNFQEEFEKIQEKYKVSFAQVTFVKAYKYFNELTLKKKYKKMELWIEEQFEKKRLASVAYKYSPEAYEAMQKEVKSTLRKVKSEIFDVKFKKVQESLKNKENKEESIKLLVEALKILPKKKEAKAKVQELLAVLRTKKKYAYIPTGTYKIGRSGEVEYKCSKSIYMGKREVTNSEYSEFVQDGGYSREGFEKYWEPSLKEFFYPRKGKPKYQPWPEDWDKYIKKKNNKFIAYDFPTDEVWKNQPVVNISFYEAQAYCRWKSQKLSQKEGKNIVIRLPSKGEWEISAAYKFEGLKFSKRANKYPWGDDFKEYQKDFEEQEEVYQTGKKGRGKWDLSASGCYNMAGNVSEWVLLKSNKSECGGLRGASFDSNNPEIQAKCAFGGFNPRPEDRFEDVGFRICMETDAYKKP